MHIPSPTQRAQGALIGLAVGDALGTTLEFRTPGTFTPIEDMVGGGPFGLRSGQWTDDTSMALCLAESLIEKETFDPEDQMTRYCRWWREGHLSSTGTCFDIGNTVREALAAFEKSGQAFSGSEDPMSAGNGSLMRLAPIPIFYHRDAEAAIQYAGESSRTTHGAREAIDACRYFAGLVVGALNGASKEELLSPLYHPTDSWQPGQLADRVEHVARGSFRPKNAFIRGTGYVVQSLEAALWAFAHQTSFESGALSAANLGDDADTTCAIFGQLAGAHYGIHAIPKKWIEKISRGLEISIMAESLFEYQAPSTLPTHQTPQ